MTDIEQQVRAIKDRLVAARKRAGLSQTQAAQMVGMACASSLSQHEGDRSCPTLELFLKLCQVYGVSPVWALTGVNPAFPAHEVLMSMEKLAEDADRITYLMSVLDRTLSFSEKSAWEDRGWR